MSSPNLLVLIEGPSGSGKTFLADELQQHVSGQADQPVAVLHLDDLYPGWQGLAEGSAKAAELIAQWARGENIRWQRFDWVAGVFGEWHELTPGQPLIVEGCGVLNATTAQHAQIRIWLDAPAALRQQRACSRGGEDYENHWREWEKQYAEYLDTHKPRSFANMTRVATR